MNKYKIYNKWLLFCIATLFIIVTFFVKSSDNNIIPLTKYSLSINNQEKKGDFNALTDNIPYLAKGDIVELTTTLPNVTYNNTYLSYKLEGTSIEVFVDNKKIYSYGEDEIKSGSYIYEQPKSIPLGYDISNKTIKIKLIASKNITNFRIKYADLINGEDLINAFMQKNALQLISSCFFILFSLFLMIIFSKFNDSELSDKKIFYISFYTFAIGCWIVAKQGILVYFVSGKISEIIETQALMLSMLAVYRYLIFFGIDNENNNGIFNKTTNNVFTISFLVTAAISFILQMFDINYIDYMLLQRIIITISVFYAGNTIYKNYHKRAINILIYILCIMAPLMFYDYLLSPRIRITALYKNLESLLNVLIPIFVTIILFIDYYTSDIKNRENETKESIYKELAFKDTLTALNNRNWYEKFIKTITFDYTIINIDLNSFKEINDTYGHTAGDELLIKFAAIINKTFKSSQCIRMGGDEFVIILNYINAEKMNEELSLMNKYIEEENSKSKIKLSISYGYAFSGDFATPKEVYECADKKMYNMKNKLKAM